MDKVEIPNMAPPVHMAEIKNIKRSTEGKVKNSAPVAQLDRATDF